MPIRLYHPNLTPPDNECEVMDDAQVAILYESGWRAAPEPAAPDAGHAPEPARYELVEPMSAKRASKTTKSTDH